MKFFALALSVSLFPATTAATAQDDRDVPHATTPVITLRSMNKATDITSTEKTGLTRTDFARISWMLEGKATLVPLRTVAKTAGPAELPLRVSVTGTTSNFAKLSHLRITQGRFLSPNDLTQRNNVAVVDSRTAAILFPGEKPVGQTFRIEKEAFVVVGVCDRSPASPSTGEVGRFALIPVTTMRSRFGDLETTRGDGTFVFRHFELSEIRIALNDSMHLTAVVEAIKKLLDAAHEPEAYSVEVQP